MPTRSDSRSGHAAAIHDLAEARGDLNVDALLSDLASDTAIDRQAVAQKALLDLQVREAEALKLLAHIDRDLRNIVRMTRRLLGERGALAASVARLHREIRAMEASLAVDAHRDHQVDLNPKGVVQFVADETWRMDNRKDWGYEEAPEGEDYGCPISEVTQPRPAPSRPLRLVPGEHRAAKDAS